MSSSDETTTRTGDAMRLLEILTPGGSEFHENPQRCAAWVQERLDSAQRLTVRAYTERNEMRQENARLRERVAALEGAVKSFARAKAEWDRLWDDTESLVSRVPTRRPAAHPPAPARCGKCAS